MVAVFGLFAMTPVSMMAELASEVKLADAQLFASKVEAEAFLSRAGSK